MSNQTQTADVAGPVVARAGTYYRNARYIMFAIIVTMGVWFLYDGFVKYPAENVVYDDLSAKIQAMDRNPQTRDEADYLRLSTQRKTLSKHDTFSLGLQKVLGFALPPMALGLLGWWLYKSRGVICLENGLLTAPGHPPVPLASIDELDKGLWEKKGIATVYYTLPGKVTGKVRLDDFIYEAIPVREIVKQVEAELQSQDKIIEQVKKEAGAVSGSN